MRRLDDLGIEPADASHHVADPLQGVADGVRRAVMWGRRYDFVFAGDWLARMHDAGADYDCLHIWVLLHTRRERHGHTDRLPGEPLPPGGKDRTVASVLGTTRLDGETERDHLTRMGRQVELAFLRRSVSVPGPMSAGSYGAIASKHDIAIPFPVLAVLESSPFDVDRVTATHLADRVATAIADGYPVDVETIDVLGADWN